MRKHTYFQFSFTRQTFTFTRLLQIVQNGGDTEIFKKNQYYNIWWVGGWEPKLVL